MQLLFALCGTFGKRGKIILLMVLRSLLLKSNMFSCVLCKEWTNGQLFVFFLGGGGRGVGGNLVIL